jgi:hypothetical protein
VDGGLVCIQPLALLFGYFTGLLLYLEIKGGLCGHGERADWVEFEGGYRNGRCGGRYNQEWSMAMVV